MKARPTALKIESISETDLEIGYCDECPTYRCIGEHEFVMARQIDHAFSEHPHLYARLRDARNSRNRRIALQSRAS